VVVTAQGKMTWNAQDSDGVASSSLTVDGKAATVNGPYTAASGVNFSGAFGSLAAGTHNYTITAVDKLGNSSQYTGTFSVVSNPGPTIGGVVVVTAQGLMTWNAQDSDGVASSSLTVDGTAAKIYGPYTAASGVNYSGVFGALATGTHNYTITATDGLGNVSTSNGSFTLVAPTLAAKNALFSAASQSASGNSAKVNWLYDFDGLTNGTQSSSEEKNTSASAVDAVMAAY
jgi:hypothetical protein